VELCTLSAALLDNIRSEAFVGLDDETALERPVSECGERLKGDRASNTADGITLKQSVNEVFF
jgi:hypothetical protein